MVGLNTILFQKIFTYTCIIDIQQIDQDLIVSSRSEFDSKLGQDLIVSWLPVILP